MKQNRFPTEENNIYFQRTHLKKPLKTLHITEYKHVHQQIKQQQQIENLYKS